MTIGTLPIKPVVAPDDLAGIYMRTDSGKLDPALLVSVGPSGLLHHDAARAYNALAFLCLGINLPLTYTYGGCYRSYASQVQLFLQRYQLGYIAGRRHETYQGQVYSLKAGVAGAAAPGQSNHGWGIAIDVAFDSNPSDGIGPDDAAGITGHPGWQQFKLYALACGFSWETTAEPWHIRLVTGSNPTQQVLDVEAFINNPPVIPAPAPAPAPAPEPAPAPTPDPAPAPVGEFGAWPTTPKPITKLGATGEVVSYLQSVLKIKLGYVIGVDGNWGPVTNNFVVWFQATHGLLSDGVCGPKTWAAIDAIALS